MLHPGSEVRLGDALALELQLDHASHVYVINEDSHGERFQLFHAPGETEEQGESEDGAASGAVAGQRLVVGDIASREDVIRMLDKICDYFSRYEPSSPVPFLLKRAKNLVTKDFMEIMLDLAPGGTEQANLIFGLQSESSSESG